MIKHSYERTVTDNDYSKIPEIYNSIWSYFYSNKINEPSVPLTFDNLDKKFKVIANDNYLVFDIEPEYKLSNWIYLVFPTLFLFAFLLPLLNSDEETPIYVWVLIVISSIIILGIFLYEYKRPKKEYIFDRMNGVITFPDFAWKKITQCLLKKLCGLHILKETLKEEVPTSQN